MQSTANVIPSLHVPLEDVLVADNEQLTLAGLLRLVSVPKKRDIHFINIALTSPSPKLPLLAKGWD